MNIKKKKYYVMILILLSIICLDLIISMTIIYSKISKTKEIANELVQEVEDI